MYTIHYSLLPNCSLLCTWTHTIHYSLLPDHSLLCTWNHAIHYRQLPYHSLLCAWYLKPASKNAPQNSLLLYDSLTSWKVNASSHKPLQLQRHFMTSWCHLIGEIGICSHALLRFLMYLFREHQILGTRPLTFHDIFWLIKDPVNRQPLAYIKLASRPKSAELYFKVGTE